jgi:hypothetical protein
MQVKLRFPIKGLYYYSAEQLFDLQLVQPHRHLTIELEPDNRFDANAIQLWLRLPEQNFLVGYIPRQLAKIIRHALNEQQILKLENRINCANRVGKWMEIELELNIDLGWHDAMSAMLFALWLRQKHNWQKIKKKK